MATLLTCQKITKAFGTRVLFDGLSISFADDERVGLIGPNGAGKSVFLKILAGLEPEDTGEVSRRRAARIAYLPQEDRFPEGATVRTVLAEAIAERYPEEHARETQVSITLSKFGFQPQHDRADALSGGWRKRLALAREIIQEPDLLLMDEPTNHLDLAGILWLEELLARPPFAFLLVSHDRYFLENVTNRVVELNPVYPDGYFSVAGNYSLFLEKRADFLDAQQAQQVTLANIVRREAAFLKSNSKAQRKKSKSRIEEAYRLHDELRDLQRRNTQTNAAGIDFDATGRRSRMLLEAKGLAKSLGGRRLFHDTDVLLAPGTRLGLLGVNGSGKTTLIRVLTGDLPADAGTIRQADDLRVVVFDQKREQLPQGVPLRKMLAAESDQVEFRGKPVHITAWAKRFLFRTDQLELPLRELSGGEQARVLIARLMLKPADVLVLDEPTNDLDIGSLEVLEDSLSEFPGAIVLVTHDRFLLDRLCTELLELRDGTVNRYADFAQWQAAQRSTPDAPSESPERSKAKSPASAAPRKKLSASEQKELKDMEETILAAEQTVEERRLALDDPAIAADHVETQKRWAELEAARRDVEALYARWEELESKAR
ncbi:MAG TPA: ABC-F family ATP-binding cassette domain-containing protein [Phycisphaerae bacterium]|nr:ABC-F family ATP-binding cassette domain-containing protein [Phycisphaerae bacterium]